VKLRLLAVLLLALACADVTRAAAQGTPSADVPVPAAAEVSLDLPHVSYATVDGRLVAPADELRSSSSLIPMPPAARKGTIGGAIAGAVVGGAFGWFTTSTCDTGACSSVREGLVAGTAYGVVFGAALGYTAGRVWHAVRN
jgi:hypothetical protein